MADDQSKKASIFELGAARQQDNSPETSRERLRRTLVKNFEAQGSSPDEAEHQALLVMEELQRFGAGRSWGGLHAEGIPQIVHEAMRQGARRLVLEIEAEGEHEDWFGHLNITIKQAQTWEQWEHERQERAQREKN